MSGVDFASALTALKAGKRAAREGWNGKGMFVYRVPPASYPAQTPVAKAVFGDLVPYRAYFAIRGADGMVATWVPSSTDLDAEDWVILNEDGTEHVVSFRDRLQTERLELDQRIQKLAGFLPTPQFRELELRQRELLISQLDTMKRYCGILTAREVALEAN